MLEQMETFINSGGVLLMGASAAVSAIIVIINGGGKFGNWLRNKLTKDIEETVEENNLQLQKMEDFHKSQQNELAKHIQDIEVFNYDTAKKIEDIHRILKQDLDDKKKHEADIRFIYEVLDIVLEHEQHGNHVEQIAQYKINLHQRILKR